MTLKRAFTLIELLLVIGIIGILSAVTIVAIDPPGMLSKGKDAARRSAIREIENGILTHLIGGGTVSGFPYGKTLAKNLCRETVTGLPCTTTLLGIDLAVLVPDVLAALPVDPDQTVSTLTGYRGYRDGSFFKVCSPILDPTCGVSDQGGTGGSSGGGSGGGTGGSGGGGSCGITPLSYDGASDLRLWLDASSGARVLAPGGNPAANNGLVEVWDDRSPDGNDTIQSTSALQPVYKTAEGGSLLFDGVDSYLRRTANVSNLEGTTFVVFKNAVTMSERALLSIDGGSNQGTYVSIVPAIRTDERGIKLWHRTSTAFYGANTCTNVDNNKHYVTLEHGSPKVWFDGFLQNLLTANGSNYQTLATPTTFNIGDVSANIRGIGGNIDASNASIMEVISYAGKLGATERGCIDSYLQEKWSIAPGSTAGNTADCSYVCCLTSDGTGTGCGCGNGVIQGNEQCDDGNMTSGDGCSMTCQNEGSGIFTQTRSGGTFENEGAWQPVSWTFPERAGTSNDSRAIASGLTELDAQTTYLKATNFGFSIPSGATILGITVNIERRAPIVLTNGNGAVIADFSTRIVKNGVIGMSEYGAADYWPLSDVIKAYGGDEEVWGETWTPATINATGFGIALGATIFEVDFEDPLDAEVDHISITVRYQI